MIIIITTTTTTTTTTSIIVIIIIIIILIIVILMIMRLLLLSHTLRLRQARSSMVCFQTWGPDTSVCVCVCWGFLGEAKGLRLQGLSDMA